MNRDMFRLSVELCLYVRHCLVLLECQTLRALGN